MTEDIILEARGLSKEFKGFVAVKEVNLRIRRGTIHALIGPNGAGKSTVFNLLTKFLAPTRGHIYYNQISAVFPHLSVLENVRVALQRPRGTSFHFWKPEACLHDLHDRALELIEAVNLSPWTSHTAADLPYGRKRALEIATTLALDPEVVLLDEPLAGMGHEDIERTAALIRSVSANRTILMVEHNLSVVADLSDTITVLQRGEILAEGPYATVSRNPQVMAAYMGTEHGGMGHA
jgi:branched-chain amino acid transport system ATP-binding protein